MIPIDLLRRNPVIHEITDEMVMVWFREAELEERRSHVLFEDDYIDPEHVLEFEQSRHFARIYG